MFSVDVEAIEELYRACRRRGSSLNGDNLICRISHCGQMYWLRREARRAVCAAEVRRVAIAGDDSAESAAFALQVAE